MDIRLPDLGEGIDLVDISEVMVRVGETLQEDDPVLLLESDKATMEIPTGTSGVVKEILVTPGDQIRSGDVIIRLEAEDRQISPTGPAAGPPQKELVRYPVRQLPDPLAEAAAVETAAPVERPAAAAEIAPPTPPSELVRPLAETSAPRAPEPVSPPAREAHPEKPSSRTPLASPAVRRFARELGADLSLVAGRGPKGRITKEDVQIFIQAQLKRLASLPLERVPRAPREEIDFSLWGKIERRPLGRIRRLTAERMLTAWQTVPQVTQFDRADITALEEYRHKLRKEHPDLKITLLPFLMQAVVQVLRELPDFNASLDVRGENLIYKKYFHLGVAVDTPRGLLVPVFREVDQKDPIALTQELMEVISRAREGQIRPEELKGGCFTISSLGGVGGSHFAPIVNPPEVAVLGVSQTRVEPVYEKETLVPRTILPLSLSYDHRVIDGVKGARFTTRLAEILADREQFNKFFSLKG